MEALLELLDAGTSEHLRSNHKAASLTALIARIIAHTGLIRTLTTDCPWCHGAGAMTIRLERNEVTCGACRRDTTIGGLMDEPGAQERLQRLMRARPRSR